jgi:DNA-binding XRE family transcriptional regulator
MEPNNRNKVREKVMISKAELAKKAEVSPITISRIEDGMPCRMDTQRKILHALGYKISERTKVFP